AFTQTFSFVVPANAPSNSTITVQAAATDTAGGQSQPAIVTLNVVDLSRPVVLISSPINNSVVTGAQVVHVVIDATDDVALASVSLTCNPAVLGCETRAVSPPAAAAHQTFDITIPTGLQAPQSVALSVIATDTSGNAGTAGRVLQIADTIKPSILSLESASGSTHLAVGDVAVLRATVGDNVGVTALAFATDGAFTTSGVTTVAPAITNGVATLSIAVPATAPN